MNNLITLITQAYPVVESTIARLDPAEKALWLEALRSGKYTQGMHVLETFDGGFCCLGVYCDAKGVPKQHSVEEDDESRIVYGNFNSENDDDWDWGVIPAPWAIPHAAGDGRFTGEQVIFYTYVQGSEDFYNETKASLDYHEDFNLPTLNDSGEFTFDQIADIIDYFL